MTIKGGSNKACAACKYQRRRCSKECPLAPYFPADQPKKFQNAHRLFGVCNMMRILKEVHPEQKDDAMESIIFESDMRAKYPVDGCLNVIWQYNCMLMKTMEELRYVKSRLAIYKEQYPQYHLSNYQISSPPECSMSSQQQLQFGMATNGDALPVYNNHLQHNNGKFSMVDVNGVYNDGGYVENEDNLVKPFTVQQPCYNNGITNVNATNTMAAQCNFIGMQGYSNQQELGIPADYDDIIPFDAIVDDRQSFIECKETCESSAESSFRDATQHIDHVSKYELKNAAACFSLTN